MSDVAVASSVPIPDEGKAALVALENQIAGMKAMIPGAKQAGMDVSVMEQTVAALERSLEALRSIPGAK